MLRKYYWWKRIINIKGAGMQEFRGRKSKAGLLLHQERFSKAKLNPWLFWSLFLNYCTHIFGITGLGNWAAETALQPTFLFNITRSNDRHFSRPIFADEIVIKSWCGFLRHAFVEMINDKICKWGPAFGKQFCFQRGLWARWGEDITWFCMIICF